MHTGGPEEMHPGTWMRDVDEGSCQGAELVPKADGGPCRGPGVEAAPGEAEAGREAKPGQRRPWVWLKPGKAVSPRACQTEENFS